MSTMLNKYELLRSGPRAGWGALALVAALLATACDDDGSGGDPQDRGVVGEDRGPTADRGPVRDAAVDAARDAEPDLGPEPDAEVEPDLGPDAGPPGHPIWAYLDDRQAELRASPDHLVARAEALVAAGDAEAIFNFVRDTFAVVPAGQYAWFDFGAVYRHRIGPRGVLRSGAGTPREIVDLLADLLTRAGHPARPLIGTWLPADADAAFDLWLRDHTPPAFAPAGDPASVAAARARAGLGAPGVAPARPDTAPRRAALSARLLASLGAEAARDYDFEAGFDYPLPLVAVEVGGETRYAHPFHPEAVFGEAYGEPAEFSDLEPVTEAPELRLALEVHTARGAMRRVAEAAWPLPEVVGRPIALGLRPNLPGAEALTTAPDDVPLAVGTFALHRDAAMAEDAVNVVVGTPFGLEGEVLVVEPDGTLQFQASPLEPPVPGLDPARVARLAATANASRFPMVQLDLRAEDADGNFVPGLGSAAFTVFDEDAQRPFLLRRNTEAPRVQVLYDTSASMPFWVLDNPEAIAEAIAARVRAEEPRAQVTLVPTDSDLWRSTVNALSAAPDAIIYLTDGDTTDAYDPGEASTLAAGPAPLIIGVGDGFDYPEYFDELVARTGAQVVVADDLEAVLAGAEVVLANLPEGTYRLNHRAPADAAGTRTVTVRLPNGVETSATYTVPPAGERAVGDAIVGLSLSFELDGVVVKRHLVGDTLGTLINDPIRARALANEVRLSLGARHWLFVEGDTLLPSLALDEHIEALKAARPLFDLDDFSPEAVTRMLEEGVDQRPTDVLAVFQPLPAPEGAHIFAHRGRFALVQHRRVPITEGPDAGGQALVRRLDLVPVASLSVAGPRDGAARFATVLESSLERAFIEAAIYPTATANRVADDGVVPFEGAAASFDDPDGPAAQRLAEQLNRFWFYAWTFVDADRVPDAAWAVDPTTGEAYALLPDGSGGGEEEVSTLRDIEVALKLTNAISSALGQATDGARAPYGTVLTLATFVANLYGAAAIVVATLSAAWEPAEVQQAVALAACQVTEELDGDPYSIGIDPIQIFTQAALADLWGFACD